MTTTKAYMKNKGTVDYKNCKIEYYTYNLEGNPKEYHVNVNITMHTHNDYVKSLPLDEKFKEEQEAIDFAIAQGKDFIEASLVKGKNASVNE